MDNNRQPLSERFPENPEAARRHRIESHNMAAAALCAAMILLFAVINILLPDSDYSETENRRLQRFPSLSIETLEDGSWFSEFQSYVSDQFFARDGWISLRLKVSRLFGAEESGGIYLGQDDYLLKAPVTPDTDAENRTLSAVAAFTEKHPDLNQCMILVPDAAAILSDKLPENAPVRDQIADISAFLSALPESVGRADAVYALQQHTTENIYYKTDHHWTSLGAYYVFMNAAGLLGVQDIPAYNVYTVADDFQGTSASASGCYDTADTVQVFLPENSGTEYYVYYADSGENVASMYQSSALDTKDKYTVFFGGNHPLTEIHTTADNGRSLLVFKDSYANCFMQFLTPYFENIVMIDPRYYYDSLDTLLTSEGITDVLYLYSADTLLTDGYLADVLETG